MHFDSVVHLCLKMREKSTIKIASLIMQSLETLGKSEVKTVIKSEN